MILVVCPSFSSSLGLGRSYAHEPDLGHVAAELGDGEWRRVEQQKQQKQQRPSPNQMLGGAPPLYNGDTAPHPPPELLCDGCDTEGPWDCSSPR